MKTQNPPIQRGLAMQNDPDRLAFTRPRRFVVAWLPLGLAWALLVVAALWLGGAP